jgi:hypothetical protein
VVNHRFSLVLQQLAEELGFHETEQLTELRDQIALTGSLNDAILLYHDYERLGRHEVDARSGQEGTRAQLGLQVALARVWHEQGDLDRFCESLHGALMLADGLGYLQTVEAIDDILNVAGEDE